MSWISVKKRLPQTKDRVLVVHDYILNHAPLKDIGIAYYCPSRSSWISDSLYMTHNATILYWQELPEMPESINNIPIYLEIYERLTSIFKDDRYLNDIKKDVAILLNDYDKLRKNEE